MVWILLEQAVLIKHSSSRTFPQRSSLHMNIELFTLTRCTYRLDYLINIENHLECIIDMNVLANDSSKKYIRILHCFVNFKVSCKYKGGVTRLIKLVILKPFTQSINGHYSSDKNFILRFGCWVTVPFSQSWLLFISCRKIVCC